MSVAEVTPDADAEKVERIGELSDFHSRMFSIESNLVSNLKTLTWPEEFFHEQSLYIEKKYGLKRSGPDTLFTEFGLDKFGVNDLEVFLERLDIDQKEFDEEIERRIKKGPYITPRIRNYRINGDDVYSRDRTLVISFLHMYRDPGSESPGPGKYFHYFGVSGDIESASKAFDACLDRELCDSAEYSFGGRDYI